MTNGIPHHTNAGNAQPSKHWQVIQNQGWPERDENGPHARNIPDLPIDQRYPVRVRLRFAQDGWDILPGIVHRQANGCVYVHVDDRRVTMSHVWVSERDVREG